MTWIAGGPGGQALLLAFGANYGPLVADGDWWRLVTSIFLHEEILHLALNAYALYFLGRNLEAFYGARGLFVLFLGSGIAGSTASALLSNAPSVGASGGVFGLLGASIVFAFRYRGVLPKRIVTIMGTALVPWIALNFGMSYFLPAIDVHAHWGGLVGGALLALVVRPAALDEAFGRPARDLRFLTSLGLSILIVSFAAAAQNMFALRSEAGVLLDPRIATDLPDQNLDGAIESDPTNTALLSMRAQREVAAGDWIEAIRDYQKILTLEPESAESLNNLAWLLLEEAPEELRNHTEAGRLAERAIALAPENAYVLGTYGTVLLRRGDPREAAAYLERALAEDRPKLDEATDRYLLATALARAGRFEEAERVLRDAVRQDPENRYRLEAEEAVGVPGGRHEAL
jgi:rhomboid protease GluP